MYLLYANSRAASPLSNGTLFPESPLYCGREFVTVGQILGPTSESLRLLELLRKMTCVFQAEDLSNTEALSYFHRRVMSFKSKLRTNVPSRQDRTYEAIRLTARVYADALVGNVDFSQASSHPTQRDDPNEQYVESPSAFVEIVRNLMHTDLDRMWGGLSGVLFFIVMVAGAASKGAQVKELTEAADLMAERQEEEARRWLAAVAVRCSIILGFEHGGALLSTLQTMLYIQDKLSGRNRHKLMREVAVGPERETASQSGFRDFAWEFLAEDR